VVIDTNLVLSALVFAGGRLAPLRLAWQGQRCCLWYRAPRPPN
jgi:predicted nucleic acid-binding protein